jgi:CBS domain-containing protein
VRSGWYWDAGEDSFPRLLRESRQTEFPVGTADGRRTGLLTREAVREAMEREDRRAPPVVAANLVWLAPGRVTPDDSPFAALRAFAAHDVGCLPVIDPKSERLLGIVSRRDLFAAYERALTTEAR